MSRILVADDDAIQLDLRKQLLEIAGYQVDVAFTALQTDHLLRKRPPDLVIVDLRLPNEYGESDAREGLALIRRIREIATASPSWCSPAGRRTSTGSPKNNSSRESSSSR